ncbi:MAG: hypothetical protein HGA19_18720, partial [Oscillochloris sp.]|nr:hypothetical protein [Oscillochloris sp.]
MTETPLFYPANQAQPAALAHGVIRSRAVLIDWAQLAASSGATTSAAGDSARLVFNLFDDVSIVAVRDHVEYREPGSYSWFGHSADDPASYSIFVVHDGIMVGSIAQGSALYQVRYAGNGMHEVQEVDATALMPSQHDTVITEALAAGTSPRSDVQPSLARDLQASTPTVDLMVVYSPAAQQGAGGDTAMEALVQLSVDIANFALDQSQVQGRLRLVHTQLVNYTDSGTLSTDLSRLATSGDGYLDDALTLRSTYGADLVSLFVGDYATECGLGQVLWSATGETPFSALTYGCGGGMSLAHELGHNMSLCHDALNGGCLTRQSFHPYANGYQDPQGRFRDIMAYANGCAVLGGCTRVSYFSNPRLSFNGSVLGSAQADNVQALNATMPIAAGWQDTRVSSSGELPVVEVSAAQIAPMSSALAGKLTGVSIATLDQNTIAVTGKNADNSLALSIWQVAATGQFQQIATAAQQDIDDIGAIRRSTVVVLSPTRIVTRIDLDKTCGSGAGGLFYHTWDINAQGDLTWATPNPGWFFCETVAGVDLVPLSSTRFAAARQSDPSDASIRLGILEVAPSGSVTYGNGGVSSVLSGTSVAVSALEASSGTDERTLVLIRSLANQGGLAVVSYRVSADGLLSWKGEQLMSHGASATIASAGTNYAVSADQATDGKLRLSIWRASTSSLGQISALRDRSISTVSAAPLSTGRVVTIVHDADAQQAAQLWGVSARGQITPLAENNSAMLRQTGVIESTELSSTRLVAADTVSGGNVMLQLWEVQSLTTNEGNIAYLTVMLDTPASTAVTVNYAVTG